MENTSFSPSRGDRKHRAADPIVLPQHPTPNQDRSTLTDIRQNHPLSPRVFEYPAFPFSPNANVSEILDSIPGIFEQPQPGLVGSALPDNSHDALNLPVGSKTLLPASSSSLVPASSGRASMVPENSTTAVVRRENAHQLAPVDSAAQWPNFPVLPSVELAPVDRSQGSADTTKSKDNDRRLMDKALDARFEAKGKNKEIPPFVKKLEAYLSDDANRNLIRWSTDGKSFIILDDEAFAKTLIPQRFKHNNYASFVRQLNMYGFHKRIGLEDGSLMSNELGAKTPHTYDHPCFQRDKPELQWLITKPKTTAPTGTSSKRKRGLSEDDGPSDDDDDGRGGDGGTITVPRSEWNMMKAKLAEYQMSAQQMQSNTQHFIKALQDLKNDSELEKSITRQRIHALEGMSRQQAGTLSTILSFISKLYANHTARNAAGQALSSGCTQMISPRNIGAQSTSNALYNIANSRLQSMASPDLRSSPMQMGRSGRRPIALLPAPDRAEGASPSFLASDSSVSGSRRGGGVDSPASVRLATPSLPSTVPTPQADPFGQAAVSSADFGTTSAPPPASMLNGMAAVAPIPNVTVAPSTLLTTPAQAQAQARMPARAGHERTPSSSVSVSNGGGLVSAPPTSNDVLGSIDMFEAEPKNYMNPLEGLSHLPQDQQFSQLTDHLAKQDQRMRGLVDRIEPLTPNGMIPGLNLGSTDDPAHTSGANPIGPGSGWDESAGIDWTQFLVDTVAGATDLFPTTSVGQSPGRTSLSGIGNLAGLGSGLNIGPNHLAGLDPGLGIDDTIAAASAAGQGLDTLDMDFDLPPFSAGVGADSKGSGLADVGQAGGVGVAAGGGSSLAPSSLPVSSVPSALSGSGPGPSSSSDPTRASSVSPS